MNVPPECCQLLLLEITDSPRGIENDYVDVRPSVKGVGNGAARVAAGRHKDLDPAGFPLEERLHGRREELCAEVLERARRAVEKLEEENPIVKAAEDRRESESVRGQVPGTILVDIR